MVKITVSYSFIQFVLKNVWSVNQYIIQKLHFWVKPTVIL